MKHTRVVSTKCTPGFACRAFSDTTLVCFIVNEHTTKCSHYRHSSESANFLIYDIAYDIIYQGQAAWSLISFVIFFYETILNEIGQAPLF